MLKRILVVAISALMLASFALYSFGQTDTEPAGKGYIISADDVLEITVYQEGDLSVSVHVTPEGTINYPLLGKIKAAGFTVRQLERHITDLLAEDYLVMPQVSIFIKEYAKISILGQVKAPGSYQMKENLTLTEVIAMASGFNDGANSSKVKIIRTIGDNKETLEVNVDQILDKAAADVAIRPNDIIMVELYGRYSIMGQVLQPGVYNLRKGLTAMEAIGLAGGFAPAAAQAGTRVIRNDDGQKKVIRVPVRDIIKGEDRSKDILLQEGDTIVVPESFF